MRTSTRARAARTMPFLMLLVPLFVTVLPGTADAGPRLVGQAGHGGLLGSDPAAGSSLTVAPLFVRLDFGHRLIDLGAAVRVTGPDGAVVSSGPPRVYPSTLTQALDGTLPAGRYQVSWRVTGQDGLPLTGQFGFSTRTAGSASLAPAVLPAGPGTQPVPAPSGLQRMSLPAMLATVLLGALAVSLIVVLVAVSRRRRERQAGSR